MLYVVNGSAGGKSVDDIMAIYPRHREFLQTLVDEGVVVAAAPFADFTNMAIFTTRDAAERFVAGDPFVLEGVVGEYTVREWNAQLYTVAG